MPIVGGEGVNCNMPPATTSIADRGGDINVTFLPSAAESMIRGGGDVNVNVNNMLMLIIMLIICLACNRKRSGRVGHLHTVLK